MSTLHVELGERSYPIHIRPHLLDQNDLFQADRNYIIVTNHTLQDLIVTPLLEQSGNTHIPVISIEDGEQFKTLASFDYVISRLLEMNASRDTILIAIGGGVIGDLTGFVAASYQRGMPFIQVPTTLLSQVDSSVGGKTAVNHPLGKNMIGAFYQPQSVFIDTATLSTLPAKEFAAGMAEVIKYGIIYDQAFFSWLEENVEPLRKLDPATLEYAIYRCCQIKAEVVAQDERETGLRAILNLGHTFGHAIEAEQGYGSWLHGEAVAAGIVLASQVAVEKNWLSPSELRRIEVLLQQFDLPVAAPQSMNYDTFMKHMAHDKKVKAGKIRFVIPTGIGSTQVTDDVSQEVLQRLLG